MRDRDSLLRDTEPFPEAVIEQLPGRGGGPPLDYVAWNQYNQRLLLHHPDHEYRVKGVWHSDGLWCVAVEFTIDGQTYGGVGEDSAPTAAESNAYKRALAHAGIGLHLYGGYWLHDRLGREE
jgi:hypothetical protein